MGKKGGCRVTYRDSREYLDHMLELREGGGGAI